MLLEPKIRYYKVTGVDLENKIVLAHHLKEIEIHSDMDFGINSGLFRVEFVFYDEPNRRWFFNNLDDAVSEYNRVKDIISCKFKNKKLLLV
jgi:hypothetical protein